MALREDWCLKDDRFSYLPNYKPTNLGVDIAQILPLYSSYSRDSIRSYSIISVNDTELFLWLFQLYVLENYVADDTAKDASQGVGSGRYRPDIVFEMVGHILAEWYEEEEAYETIDNILCEC